MAKLRVGSIGVGGISQGVHLPGIAQSEDMELKAICDIDTEKLKKVGDKYGIEEKYRFTDFMDLINCPEVDVVDISTPNCEHFRMAKAAIEAGKCFDVEKPMTMNAEEAYQLATLAKIKKVRNMVCFSYRYKAAARYARDLVRSGELGEIYHVDAQYYQAWGLPFFETPKVWRFDKKLTGSGTLGDLGSHALDLVRFITGEEYTAIVGHTGTFVNERKSLATGEMENVDVDDFSNYMANLSGGGAATFRITRFGYGRGNYQYVEVYGSKGALVYQLDYNNEGKDTLEVCLGKDENGKYRFERVEIPEKYKVQQMQCFADVVLGKDDGLNATVNDGAINMLAVDAVLKSAEEGQWIKL